MHKVSWYALVVFVAGVSYGFLVPFVKLARSYGHAPSDILPSMYLLTLAIFGVCALVRRERPRSLREVAELLLIGVLTSCTSIFYYNAVAVLPSAVASTLLFQYVWIGIVIDCIVFRHLPERITVLVVAIVLVGTCLAAGLFEGSFSNLNGLGLLLAFCSAITYAVFLFASGRLGRGAPNCLRMAMVGLGGTVVTLVADPGYLVRGMFFDLSTWPFAVALDLVGVIVPVLLIAYATPHLHTGIVNIMAASELPAGVLSAWAIVGDEPSVLALVGVFLVLAGIVVNQLPLLMRRRKGQDGGDETRTSS